MLFWVDFRSSIQKMSFGEDLWGSEFIDRKYLKCYFGETFGNQKRLKMSFYFLNVILGIFWQIYFFLESVVLGRFQDFNICHFGEISALQYMSFWGDFSTLIYVILGRFRGKNKK